MNFKNRTELEKYLIYYIYKNTLNSLKHNHTRKDLSIVLKWLFPHNNWTLSMCKERQVKHIEWYFNLHHINIEKWYHIYYLNDEKFMDLYGNTKYKFRFDEMKNGILK